MGSMLKRMGEWQRIPGNKEFNTKKEYGQVRKEGELRVVTRVQGTLMRK